MKILITGATGYVGKRLINALDIDGNELFLLTRGSQIDTKKEVSVSSLISTVSIGTLNWKQEIKNFNPAVVIHLAAFLTSSDNTEDVDSLVESNIEFGTHLLEALKGTEIQYFINTGSFAEYGENGKNISPVYLYAATKTAFRSILEYFRLITGFKVINVIPYSIYGYKGKKMKLIDYLLASVNAQKPISMSPGNQILDFIHLDDVINFYVSLVRQLHKISRDYTEIHLGSGIGHTPREISQHIEKITGRKTNVNWGGIPYRKLDTKYAVAELNRPESFIDWKVQISLEEGLEKYIKMSQE